MSTEISFTTQVGTPLDEEAFVQKHWHRALRATGVRPREFYATRHTFISLALTSGVNLMWLAKYCGTSVEMIERHYGRYMDSDEGQLGLRFVKPRITPKRPLAATPVGAMVAARREARGRAFRGSEPDPLPEPFAAPCRSAS